MNILFDIAHPAHAHLFKHGIRELRDRGHEVRLVARDKDITLSLLRDLDFEFEVLSRAKKGLGMAFEFLEHEKNLFRFCRSWRPDFMLNAVGTFIAPVGKSLGIPTAGLADTEHATLQNLVAFPLLDWILTPSCFQKSLGPRQVRVDSYHQLAHLHPDRFNPDPSVLGELGLGDTQRFFIVRFVSWGAAHDAGHKGFSESGKREIVRELSKHGRVLITSEAPLPQDLEAHRLRVPPGRIHDLLSQATLYLGEGASLASEAAMLGVPSIYVNSLSAGTLEEQEHRYGLLKRQPDEREALKLALEWLSTPGLKEQWKEKQKRMLREKLDLTRFLVEWIETNAIPRGVR